MSVKTLHIAICEPSPIIFKGITGILESLQQNTTFYKADNFDDLRHLFLKRPIDIIILNPVFLHNQIKTFHSLKKYSGSARWVGLIYNFFDQELLALFDDLIAINDSCDALRTKINSYHISKTIHSESLTERENEVLKLLVGGKSNKEIADSLHLSTHTVITHRKNISQKTGIKSVSGLTIYAVVNHLITLDSSYQ